MGSPSAVYYQFVCPVPGLPSLLVICLIPTTSGPCPRLFTAGLVIWRGGRIGPLLCLAGSSYTRKYVQLIGSYTERLAPVTRPARLRMIIFSSTSNTHQPPAVIYVSDKKDLWSYETCSKNWKWKYEMLHIPTFYSGVISPVMWILPFISEYF